MTYRALALILVVLVACGGDDGNEPTFDAPPVVDAPGASDARPDGAASSVMVISCAGVTPDATIGTNGLAFSPSGVTITAGQVVRFTPTGLHNMTAGAPGSPSGEFATQTSQEACLRFTAAGSFPFFCSVHPQMEGTVTVN
jgi:plastocyanin